MQPETEPNSSIEDLGLDGMKGLTPEDDNKDFEISPQDMDYNTFRLRTDPTPHIDELREQLTRQVKQYHKGGKYGDSRGKFDYKQKKGTTPMCNELGVEEILLTVKNIMNNHTVQGNTDREMHRVKMRSISDDLTRVFWAKRKTWALSVKDVNHMLSSIIIMMDYFLSRTINNEERIRYGETFKENTTRSVSQDQKKLNPFSKLYDFLRK